MKVLNTCKCGNKFWVKPSEILRGWGKLCSNECKYKYRSRRPIGLKYDLKMVNSGWIKKGDVPWNAGTKGLIKAWNKGLRGIFLGDKNPNWHGDNISYGGLHGWIANQLGRSNICNNCGGNYSGHKIHWANIDHKYKRNKEDWIRLCAKCHKDYDRQFRSNSFS